MQLIILPIVAKAEPGTTLKRMPFPKALKLPAPKRSETPSAFETTRAVPTSLWVKKNGKRRMDPASAESGKVPKTTVIHSPGHDLGGRP